MGRAAAGRAEGDTGALEDLEFHWGSAYDIAFADGLWTARRKDREITAVITGDAVPGRGR